MMTDRFNALVVVLEDDIREDDAKKIIEAIECLRGVLSVKGNVRDISDHTAQERAKHDLERKLWDALYR